MSYVLRILISALAIHTFRRTYGLGLEGWGLCLGLGYITAIL